MVEEIPLFGRLFTSITTKFPQALHCNCKYRRNTVRNFAVKIINKDEKERLNMDQENQELRMWRRVGARKRKEESLRAINCGTEYLRLIL